VLLSLAERHLCSSPSVWYGRMFASSDIAIPVCAYFYFDVLVCLNTIYLVFIHRFPISYLKTSQHLHFSSSYLGKKLILLLRLCIFCMVHIIFVLLANFSPLECDFLLFGFNVNNVCDFVANALSSFFCHETLLTGLQT
jgi:hypothetical protein